MWMKLTSGARRAASSSNSVSTEEDWLHHFSKLKPWPEIWFVSMGPSIVAARTLTTQRRESASWRRDRRFRMKRIRECIIKVEARGRPSDVATDSQCCIGVSIALHELGIFLQDVLDLKAMVP